MATPRLNPNISVDCVIFGFDFEQLNVLLIDRSEDNKTSLGFALPGDLIYDNEDLDMAARRVLKELTGLEDIFLKQFKAFGDPNRIKKAEDQDWLKKVRSEPGARVITIGYYSLVQIKDYQPKAASFAQETAWIPVNEIGNLPFDHEAIFSEALNAIRQQIAIRPIGFELLPEKFTLGQLQLLYEMILDRELDKRNFRRKIINLGILEQLEERQTGVAHKPARFYRFNVARYNELRETGYDNFKF